VNTTWQVLGGFLVRDIAAFALFALEVYFIWRVVVPAAIRLAYRHSVSHHQFERFDGSEGAGSNDLQYLATTYDCRRNDLIVSVRAPDALYWGIGVYGGYLRVLEGGHHNNRSVNIDPEGYFHMRLTLAPNQEGDCLDCRESPQGLLIFRILCAREDIKLPQVRVVPQGQPLLDVALTP